MADDELMSSVISSFKFLTKRPMAITTVIAVSICSFLFMCYGFPHTLLMDNGPKIRNSKLPLVQLISKSTIPPRSRVPGNISDIRTFDMVLAFPLMNDKDMAKNAGYFNYSQAKLIERDLEFAESLRKNLQHPAVSRIHLLNDEPENLAKLLKNKHGIDLRHIEIIKSSKDMTYDELFRYVSASLQDRFVIIINADMFLGDGFGQLDWSYLKRMRVMYSLTRKHLKPIPKGCGYNDKSLNSYCEKGSVYHGAHDCFIFYMNSRLPDIFFIEMKHKINAHGMENVIIWAFRKILRFTVLNPCKVLSIHHNHCSNVRPPAGIYRKRVNSNGKSGTAPMTDRLYI